MTSVLCPLPEVSSSSKQSPATNVCDSPELAVTRVQPDKLNAIIRGWCRVWYCPSPFSVDLQKEQINCLVRGFFGKSRPMCNGLASDPVRLGAVFNQSGQWL